MSDAGESQREALRQLTADGLIVREREAHRTTNKWRSAMARAMVQLYHWGDEGDDLRLPVALALVDLYRGSLNDDVLASYMAAMMYVEAA